MAYNATVRISSADNMGRVFFVEIHQSDVSSEDTDTQIIQLVDTTTQKNLPHHLKLTQLTTDMTDDSAATSFEVQVRDAVRARVIGTNDAGDAYCDEIVPGYFFNEEVLYFNIVPDAGPSAFNTTLVFEAL